MGTHAEQMAADGLKLRYERYREVLKGLTIMSDVFMRNVLKKKECTEHILQIIMGQTNLRVLDQVIQKDYKNLQGRSAMLDCVAQDAEGRLYDVEIQQDLDGASPKRARYHSGLIDMNSLDPGQDFDKLSDTYVIFVTENDILGHNRPVYHISRNIKEIGEEFQDGSCILYVNSQIQENTELGRLMHDFHCASADDMYSEILAKRVKELKETEEGVEKMCKEMDRIYQEGEKQGLLFGEKKKAKEMAVSLAGMGIAIEKIAEAAKVSVSLVQEWLAAESAH